jgi:hypothetical protein
MIAGIAGTPFGSEVCGDYSTRQGEEDGRAEEEDGRAEDAPP